MKMETAIAKIEAKDFKLEEKDVAGIAKSFKPKVVERDGYIPIYERIIKSEISPDLCKEAGDLRKKLVKVRTGIAKVHKTQKAFFLQAGKYVDALKNVETLPGEQMEEKLSEIENYYEILEQKKIDALQKVRELVVKDYIDNASELDLGAMDDDMWELFVEAKKKSHEKRIADEKAEAKRIADEKKEAERVRQENELLKNEIKSIKASKAPIETPLVGKNDDEKVESLIEHLEAVALSYSFKDEQNKAMFKGVCTLLDKVVVYINDKKK